MFNIGAAVRQGRTGSDGVGSERKARTMQNVVSRRKLDENVEWSNGVME